MTRWSGRLERSAIYAMRRSAESRVRESSEGGRICPDLDLASLLYPPPREAKRLSRGYTTPRCPRSPPPATHARFVLALCLPAALAKPNEAGRGGARLTHQSATFHRNFPVCPLAFPSFVFLVFPSILYERDRCVGVVSGWVGPSRAALGPIGALPQSGRADGFCPLNLHHLPSSAQREARPA